MPDQNRKTILVFGATGGTGTAIVHAALARGHRVKAFVRDLSRARKALGEATERLSLCAGDAATAEDVQQVVTADVDVVISSLGVYQKKSGRKDLTLATQNILRAMQTTGLSRFICISSIGVGDSRGQGDLVTRIIQKTSLRHTLPDKESQEQAIQKSDLDWTIIRPSRLMNGNGPALFTSWTGAQPDQKLIWQINRADVATIALDCMVDATTIGQALNVTGVLIKRAAAA